MRPFLPPLLAGALARGDVAIDFSGSGFGFLESPVFLLVVLALAALSYGAERSSANRPDAERGRALPVALGALGATLGALLFAGSLAEGGREAWPGIVAGVACAALAWAAVEPLLEGARGRLDRGAGRLVEVYAEGAALLLAAVAIFVPPVAFAGLAVFLLLLVRGRRERDRKYAGLRVLR